VLVDLKPYAIPARLGSGHRRCSTAKKRVKDRVSDEAEHPDQPFGQFDRIGGGMVPCRSAGETGPDLLKPYLMVLA
jgi:hypothetical protein